MVTAEEIRAIINEALQGVRDDIALIKTDVRNMKTDLKILYVINLVIYILLIHGYSMAKQVNSMKGCDEVLDPVPLPNGDLCTAEYPTIAKLIVAGNERLPSSGGVEVPVRNDWNAGMLAYHYFSLSHDVVFRLLSSITFSSLPPLSHKRFICC
jgi:hypothetical protein